MSNEIKSTGPYTVTPFLPCNDAARAAGKPIIGWDVRDSKNLVIEPFDHEHEARDRCDELNRAEADAIYEQCITRTQQDNRVEIKCKLGQWCVSAGDPAVAEREARHYFIQYYGDGIYADLLELKKGTNETDND